jgi:hypothetical protein
LDGTQVEDRLEDGRTDLSRVGKHTGSARKEGNSSVGEGRTDNGRLGEGQCKDAVVFGLFQEDFLDESPQTEA